MLGTFQCGTRGCTYTAGNRSLVESHFVKKHKRQSTKTFPRKILPIQSTKQNSHSKLNQNRKQSTKSQSLSPNQNIFAQKKVQHNILLCPFPGCCKGFNTHSDHQRHLRIHRKVKPYRCKWPGCKVEGNQKNNLIMHIRRHHLFIPATNKELEKQGIKPIDVDNYIEVHREFL